MNYQLYIINCNNISFSTLSSFVALFSFQGTKVSARIPQYICDFLSLTSGSGGDEENRTPDPLLARQMLSQLSYTPIFPLGSPIGGP